MKKASPTVIGIWIAVCAFAAFLLVTLQNQKAAIDQEAQARTLALTRLIAEHAANNFDLADVVLQGVADALGRQVMTNPKAISEPRRQVVIDMLKTLQARSKDTIVSMSLTDAEGIVFANTVGTPPGVSLADRNYFLELKAGPVAQPVVSELIFGRVSQKWGVQVARRIEHADGTFAGMIVANLGITDAFERFYRSLDIEQDMFITIRNTTNQILVRYPMVEARVGTVVSGTPATQAVLTGSEERVLRSVSPIDNIDRIVGLRKVRNYPMYASVGLSVNVLFAEWNAQVRVALLMLLGACLASIALSVAIRRREKMSLELERHKLHLESEVQERTAALSVAKDAAEAANRAKSIFLANMSHELRTPLNAILGFAQIMERDERMPEDERRNIATINRSGSHLLSLINDVLEISRIESGRTHVIHEAFDLPAALTAVEEMIRVRAEAKGLAFVIERSVDLPTHVLGDAHHLRQVLINLVGNAVKYTDNGQITLGVRPQGEERIRFEVTDTGPGIAKDEQERIFQAFYQTEGGIAKGEGTGLGLNISRAFVRQMGGDIAITSESGKGSSFSFDIPLPATDAAPNAVRSARILGLADGQTAPRILVAEDDPDNQQVVAQLLKRIGCQVQIAANGQLAMDFLQTWRPQLIFMDMRMPVMDGYQATRAIRSLPGGENIPIVALTASTFEENLGQVLAAGCNEMVRKPIEQNRLYEVTGRLLGLRFDYAEAAPVATATGVADLKALPADLRKELREAAVTLDTEAILTIVERLRSDQRTEAATIADLVGDYRFDRIEELCR